MSGELRRIPADEVAMATLVAPKDGSYPPIECVHWSEDGMVEATNRYLLLRMRAAEAPEHPTQDFPDFDTAIPKTPPVFEIEVDLELFAKLAAHLRVVNWVGPSSVKLRFHGPTSAIEIVAGSGTKAADRGWYAIVMPLRPDEEAS